jgi:hypothetical protein
LVKLTQLRDGKVNHQADSQNPYNNLANGFKATGQPTVEQFPLASIKMLQIILVFLEEIKIE